MIATGDTRATGDARQSVSKPVRRVFVLLALVLLAFVAVFPLYWMNILGTHNTSEIYSSPSPLWFGDDLRANYDSMLDQVPFWRSAWNSVYIAVMATVTTLFFCSLGGFGFAMYDFRYKNVLFGFVIATLMIPAALNIIPYFIIAKLLNWIDQARALWVPGMASAFGIFLMRQFIASSIPRELMDAARIDGASEFRIYWSVVLPLVRPALGTLGLITFIGSWNNFIIPLIILKQDETYTLPVTLRNLQGLYSTDWGAVMLAAALTVLPLLIVFVFASRQVIEGLTQGAVKG